MEKQLNTSRDTFFAFFLGGSDVANCFKFWLLWIPNHEMDTALKSNPYFFLKVLVLWYSLQQHQKKLRKKTHKSVWSCFCRLIFNLVFIIYDNSQIIQLKSYARMIGLDSYEIVKLIFRMAIPIYISISIVWVT